VRRAFSDVGGKLVLGTPKSHHARTVPLPRFLATELTGHIANLKPDDLVFTTASGSVVRSANWRKGVFLPVGKRAGISDRFRVHDLRHYADGWVMRPAVAFPLLGAAELVLQSA